MSFVQSLADTVVATAPKLAAASPAGAAVSGAAVYALVRLTARENRRSVR